MKFLWILALYAVAVTLAVIPQEERVNGENGWYVPQADGTFEWLDKEEAEYYLELAPRMGNRLLPNPVKFYLYTKANPNEAQEITTNVQSINSSNFNAANPTRITIHGWTRNKEDYVNWGVRNALLSHGDYNMIAIDWARARSIEYISSVLAVPGVGEKIANMVNLMVKECGLNLGDLEIIGHSLGAHVAGFTGKNIVSGKAHAIVGLDPALPLYSYDKPDKRLSSSDANYVESIQTNGGKLGFLKPIGKGAFYPNGGEWQPGCGLDITGNCSHVRSVVYYKEAVELDNFATIKCSDYEEAVDKNCGEDYSDVRMAAIENAYMEAGDYYVPVHDESPYGVLLKDIVLKN